MELDQTVNEITINGVVYVPKTTNLNGMDYCIIRTHSAGVFAGYVEARNGKEVTIRNVRRIWSWAGANSLSELAVNGTSKPAECRFAIAVDKIEVTETIEILYCTAAAKKSIEGVQVWSLK